MFLGVFMNANPPNLWKKSKNKINYNVFTDIHLIQLKSMQNAIFFFLGGGVAVSFGSLHEKFYLHRIY